MDLSHQMDDSILKDVFGSDQLFSLIVNKNGPVDDFFYLYKKRLESMYNYKIGLTSKEDTINNNIRTIQQLISKKFEELIRKSKNAFISEDIVSTTVLYELNKFSKLMSQFEISNEKERLMKWRLKEAREKLSKSIFETLEANPRQTRLGQCENLFEIILDDDPIMMDLIKMINSF